MAYGSEGIVIKKLPKKNLVTRRVLAKILDVHMQSVTRWEQAGMPVAEPGRTGKASLYSEPDVRNWLAEREKAARENGTYDLPRERARKEKAQAILAEQTVAIRAKDLVPRDQVEKVWAAEVMAVRTKLLSWPATISDRLFREATLNGLPAVERTVKAAVDEVLLELSAPAKPKARRSSPGLTKKKESAQAPKKKKAGKVSGRAAKKKTSNKKKARK